LVRVAVLSAAQSWIGSLDRRLTDGEVDSNSSTPVDVAGLDGSVAAIAAGAYHSCALTDAGAVKCWRHNAYGEIGNGITSDSSTPVDVSGSGAAWPGSPPAMSTAAR
jgi:alpha-tubulin suppressor-like RCC1 family protein